MNPLGDQIAYYEALLAEVSGPGFKWTNIYRGGQWPYIWSASTLTSLQATIPPIQLRRGDILCMNGMNRYRKLEYLRGRFGHLFKHN